MINVTMAATASCVMGIMVHASGLSDIISETCSSSSGSGEGGDKDKKGEEKKKKGLVDHHKSKHILMGMYTALISIAGSCATAEPGGAAAIGCIAVLLNTYTDKLLRYIAMPHRSSAYSVHLTGGLWGLIAPGFFTSQKNYSILMGTAFSAADLGGTANKGFNNIRRHHRHHRLDGHQSQRILCWCVLWWRRIPISSECSLRPRRARLCRALYIAVKIFMVKFPDDFSDSGMGKMAEEYEQELLQNRANPW